LLRFSTRIELAVRDRRAFNSIALTAALEKYVIYGVGRVQYSLADFDDADRDRMPTMLEKGKGPSVKDTIRRWVQKLSS